MIEIKNLTKRFGHITAVDDLSFRVQPGEVLGHGWRRYEHVLVPVGVMSVALVLVAFGPLLME